LSLDRGSPVEKRAERHGRTVVVEYTNQTSFFGGGRGRMTELGSE
jgi:hypothetical protein